MATDSQQQKCRWTGFGLQITGLGLVFCLRLKRSERCIELASCESCELKYSRNQKLVPKNLWLQAMCTVYVHTCNVRVRMQYSGNYEIVEAITPPLSRLNVRLWELKNE